jgi:secreted Zn-dependent insulinase-like peptidase
MSPITRAVIVTLALLSGACAPASLEREAPREVLRGELDTRDYRYIELPNRLRVLLVSDPATDKAAASLRVEAGSGDDPEDRQGLAHFLEHMLFLGTERYPDPAEYQAFINAHGGSNNAYTALDHTLYFFDIEPGSLEPAIDRFSQFFAAPLFNPEYVQREMNAVDSEYRMGLKDDARREYDVLREIVQPGHPLAKLGVGNLQTLGTGDDIREDLLAFHRQHYSANLMTLVVFGRQGLDELEAMVRPRFEGIEDRDSRARKTAPALFAPGRLPMEINIIPEKETRELTLLFPVPSSRERPAAKPLDYISNLLGHEGPGGLLSILKERGLAEGLGAGAGFDLYGQDALQISVQLTESGLARRDEVVSLLLRGIAELRARGVEAWRYREQAVLGDLAFRFREQGSASGTVIGLTNALRDYAVEDVIRGPYRYADFDEALIREYLGLMTPGNMLLTVSARGLTTDRKSRWFQTPWSLRPRDPEALESAAATMPAPALPAVNEFIPAKVATKSLAKELPSRPRVLAQSPGYRLWHFQDPDFRAPRASLYFQLLSPGAGDSARDAALASLFSSLVEDSMNEFAYPATLAGLQYDVSPTSRGIVVKLGGYDDRLGVLLDKVLQSLRHTRFAPERFASLKAELIRGWGNSVKDRPFVQLVDGLGRAMVRGSWSDAELAAALAGAGEADLAAWAEGLRRGAVVEVLAHGNLLGEEAKALGERVHAALHGQGEPRAPAVEVRALPAGRSVLPLPVEHPDSALVMYLQGRDTGYRERALLALSAQVLSADFFNELRTDRQLGYAVFAQSYPYVRVPGLLLAVQSPVAGPQKLLAEFEAFLDRKSGAGVDESSFTRHRDTLAARLREKPKSLGERSERLWSELGLGAFDFDDRLQVAAAVDGITRDDWVAWFRGHLAGDGQRALLVYTEGSAHRGDAPMALPERPPEAAGAGVPAAKYYRFDWTPSVQESARALHLETP